VYKSVCHPHRYRNKAPSNLRGIRDRVLPMEKQFVTYSNFPRLHRQDIPCQFRRPPTRRQILRKVDRHSMEMDFHIYAEHGYEYPITTIRSMTLTKRDLFPLSHVPLQSDHSCQVAQFPFTGHSCVVLHDLISIGDSPQCKPPNRGSGLVHDLKMIRHYLV
jgi:hypothetical protein